MRLPSATDTNGVMNPTATASALTTVNAAGSTPTTASANTSRPNRPAWPRRRSADQTRWTPTVRTGPV